MTEHDDGEPSVEEIRQRRAEQLRRTQELDEDERRELKRLHWMRCPKCGAELDEIVFRGVRVDKCFSCGGVYLDDGELEQLAGKPGWFEALRYLFSR